MNTTIRLSFVAVASVLAVMACDTVPLTSPTGSTITLSIDRSVLPLNGETTVRAVVTESSGTAVHNGTMVTFQPSIGTTNPVEAPTVNGIATTTFIAGSISGTGFVHAFSGPARTGSGNASSGGVEVRIGAAAAGSISMSASPSSVSQSGGTVTVSALVLDTSNNPLPGVSVLFTTANGTLNPTAAISDASGIARTLLTTTQTTTVIANVGAAKGEVQVTASAAPTITVTAPDAGVVGTPVVITVSATGGSTGTPPVPRQIQSLTVGFGDGSSETRFNVTGSAAFTHTYGRAGGYTITATAVDVAGNTGTASDAITIAHAPQPTVTLTASKNNPVANEVITMTVTATATGASAPIRSVVVRSSDGQTLYTGTGSGTFAASFPSSGQKTVTATATDANGESATTSTVILVQ